MIERPLIEALKTDKAEVLSRVVRGVGVLIVDAKTRKVLTVMELRDQADKDGKQNGQMSIPLETRKKGESLYENVLGALAEAFDDEDVYGNDIQQDLIKSLFYVEGAFMYPGFTIFPGGSGTVLCDLAVIIYDGNYHDFRTHSDDEVRVMGWRPMVSFLNSEIGVRPLAKQVVETAQNLGYVERSLQMYNGSREQVRPLLDSTFSIRSYYERREQLPDV